MAAISLRLRASARWPTVAGGMVALEMDILDHRIGVEQTDPRPARGRYIAQSSPMPTVTCGPSPLICGSSRRYRFRSCRHSKGFILDSRGIVRCDSCSRTPVPRAIPRRKSCPSRRDRRRARRSGRSRGNARAPVRACEEEDPRVASPVRLAMAATASFVLPSLRNFH